MSQVQAKAIHHSKNTSCVLKRSYLIDAFSKLVRVLGFGSILDLGRPLLVNIIYLYTMLFNGKMFWLPSCSCSFKYLIVKEYTN
jgi:hypothetical protein